MDDKDINSFMITLHRLRYGNILNYIHIIYTFQIDVFVKLQSQSWPFPPTRWIGLFYSPVYIMVCTFYFILYISIL